MLLSKSISKSVVKKALFAVFPVVLCVVLSMVIMRNAWQPGLFQTHDSKYHLVRAIHFFSELQRGQFPVRVMPELAYEYSYPAFVFFYPLPYYFFSMFQFAGVSASLSIKIYLFGITVVSLLIFYSWVNNTIISKANNKTVTEIYWSASVSTIVFAFLPYRFLSIFVTGQIGGYTGLFFAILLLWAMDQFWVKKKTVLGGMVVSLAVAGLITSHVLTFVLFGIVFFTYGGWLVWRDKDFSRFIIAVGWIILGFGLSAFYLLPLLLEKSLVELGQRSLINYTHHWPTIKQLLYSPWGFGISEFHNQDGMSFQTGLSLIFGWGVGFILWLRHKEKDLLAGMMLFLFVVVFFLMLPQSNFVWILVYPFQFLQYPWRFLAVLGVVGSWIIGWSLSRLSWKFALVFGVVFIVLAMINTRNYAQPWPLDWMTDEQVKQNEELFYGSSDISWELRPTGVNDIPKEIPQSIVVENEALKKVSTERSSSGKVRYTITAEALEDTNIHLRIWHWPMWTVEVSDQTTKVKTDSERATMYVPVRTGIFKITLSLQKTAVQKISDHISIVSFIIWSVGSLAFYFWRKNYQ